ncbi:hypothetical protein M413DRAFT_27396 [Hebeloma cylindrosporum]|uniref:Uncharacterized protein n=1 Tax=Hebeloma cylindrosporum TaxID=76867 RepID=A0A0C3CDY7_HEBCY|nr:hypothetical protein M413DRAFT_27396 [Hebeloma cylindrosporum h7]
MSDSNKLLAYVGCWLSQRRHGDSIGTPRLNIEQYETLQLYCFYPMRPEMVPEERESVIQQSSGPGGIPFKPAGRQSITMIRLRAYRNDVYAKLDYALRLASGLDIKRDIKAALKQLQRIVYGRHPATVRALAASLACACGQYD